MSNPRFGLTVLLLTFSCSGCGTLLGPGNPSASRGAGMVDDFPGVGAVQTRAAQLRLPEDHPLFHLPAGAVRDDLAGLDGCWGVYVDTVSLGSEYLGLLGDVEFYHFDLSNHRLIYEVWQRVIGLLTGEIFLEHVYSVELTGPDRVTLRLLSMRGSTTWWGDEQFDVTDAEPFDLQVTLRDNAFKFGDSEGASPDLSGPHRANLVFFRVDCPE